MLSRSPIKLLLLVLCATLFPPPVRAGEIHAALLKGEVEKAKSLLAKDPGLIHSRDNARRTPLHIAARLGHVELVEWLLEHGAEVNVRAYNNFTPLHLAANTEIARLLIEHGADIEAVGSAGTVLQQAARSAVDPKGREGQEIAKLLIASGAYYDIRTAIHLNDIDRVRELLKNDATLASTRDRHGYTPLHWAAWERRAPTVKLLLEHGADVDAKGRLLETPLVKGIAHPKVVKLLLDAGADATMRVRMKGIPPNSTLLDMAVRGDHVESAKLLLAHGVDPNLRNDRGFTPLHSAAFSGHARMVRLLLKEGLEANAKTVSGWTPMSLAASKIRPESDRTKEDNARYAQVVELLHAHGVPLDLLGSIALGNVDRVRALLQSNRGLVNQKEPGTPALHSAVKLGRKEIVAVLLDRGADVNIRDAHSSTALHVAAFWGREEIAKLLIEHKADVNASTDRGVTPLHEAARLGSPGVAEVLLAAGAEVNAKDDRGRTPLTCAEESSGAAEVVELLQGHGDTK